MIRRIQAAIAAIAPGTTCSYGVIALRAGAPGRARLVGRVLRASGEQMPPLPWHRVIRADGRLPFPPGSEAWQEQCRRLQAEGVRLSGDRVEPAFRFSADDLDTMLWRMDTAAEPHPRR